MQVQPQRDPQPTCFGAGRGTCPSCNGKLIRERRRMVDRLQSLVRPLRRYRCDNFGCQWVGNIPRKKSDISASGVAQGIASPNDADAPTRLVPASVIVQMVLVAAGALFVVWYGTMESTPQLEEGEPTLGSVFQAPIAQPPALLTESR